MIELSQSEQTLIFSYILRIQLDRIALLHSVFIELISNLKVGWIFCSFVPPPHYFVSASVAAFFSLNFRTSAEADRLNHNYPTSAAGIFPRIFTKCAKPTSRQKEGSGAGREELKNLTWFFPATQAYLFFVCVLRVQVACCRLSLAVIHLSSPWTCFVYYCVHHALSISRR